MTHKLTRTRMTLLLDGGEPFDVTIRPADMLVGEEVARRNGMTSAREQPIGNTLAYAYAACLREQKYGGEFQQFRHELEAWEEHEDPVEVPPTREPSGSASSSLPTSETPDSGSTQD